MAVAGIGRNQESAHAASESWERETADPACTTLPQKCIAHSLRFHGRSSHQRPRGIENLPAENQSLRKGETSESAEGAQETEGFQRHPPRSLRCSGYD